MKRYVLMLLIIFLIMGRKGYAQSTNEVLNLLIQNKAITQEQADSLRSEAAIRQQETDAKRKLFPVNAGKAFQLGGYAQVRYQIDDASGKKDGFDIRRAYLNINGVLSPYWSYRFQADFATSPKIIDVYTEFKVNDLLNFTIGQAVVPFSLDNITSNTKLDFIDRSQVTEALVGRGKDVIGNQNGRDIGVQLGGSFWKINDLALIEYKIALLNGSGVNVTDKNESKDFSGRVVIHPWTGWGLGISVYDGVGTTASTSHNQGRSRLGYEASYENKRLSLRGEYIRGKDAAITREGFYAQAGLFIVSQKLQILGKWDVYNTDLSKTNDKTTWYILGANYYINPSVKLQFNYTIKAEESGSVNNNLAAIQLQLQF